MKIGIMEHITKNIINDEFFISDKKVIFLFMLKDLNGPYVSCQFLSFLKDRFIKGDNKGIIFVDIWWMNHNEMDDDPMFKYILFLNENINPKIIPVVSVIKINDLYKFGINSKCSGLIIHKIIAPRKIANGIIEIHGILQFILEWLLESGLDLINILLEMKIIRKE